MDDFYNQGSVNEGVSNGLGLSEKGFPDVSGFSLLCQGFTQFVLFVFLKEPTRNIPERVWDIIGRRMGNPRLGNPPETFSQKRPKPVETPPTKTYTHRLLYPHYVSCPSDTPWPPRIRLPLLLTRNAGRNAKSGKWQRIPTSIRIPLAT